MENKKYTILGLVLLMGLSAQSLAAAKPAVKPKSKTVAERVGISKQTKELWNSGQKVEAVKNYFGFGEKKRPGETRETGFETSVKPRDTDAFVDRPVTDMLIDRPVDIAPDASMFDGPGFGQEPRPADYVAPTETFQPEGVIAREPSNRVLGIERAPSVREVAAPVVVRDAEASVIPSGLERAPSTRVVPQASTAKGLGVQRSFSPPVGPPPVIPVRGVRTVTVPRPVSSSIKRGSDAAPRMAPVREAVPTRETESSAGLAITRAATKVSDAAVDLQQQYNALRRKLDALPENFNKEGKKIKSLMEKSFEEKITKLLNSMSKDPDARASLERELSEKYRSEQIEKEQERVLTAEEVRENARVAAAAAAKAAKAAAKAAAESADHKLPAELGELGISQGNWDKLLSWQHKEIIGRLYSDVKNPGADALTRFDFLLKTNEKNPDKIRRAEAEAAEKRAADAVRDSMSPAQRRALAKVENVQSFLAVNSIKDLVATGAIRADIIARIEANFEKLTPSEKQEAFATMHETIKTSLEDGRVANGEITPQTLAVRLSVFEPSTLTSSASDAPRPARSESRESIRDISDLKRLSGIDRKLVDKIDQHFHNERFTENDKAYAFAQIEKGVPLPAAISSILRMEKPAEGETSASKVPRPGTDGIIASTAAPKMLVEAPASVTRRVEAETPALDPRLADFTDKKGRMPLPVLKMQMKNAGIEQSVIDAFLADTGASAPAPAARPNPFALGEVKLKKVQRDE